MKFSIRDLFLVTMIVALAVGWGVDRWRQASLLKAQEQDAMGFDLLKSYMTSQGYQVEWEPDLLMLSVYRPGEKPWSRIVGEGELPTSQAPAPNPPKP